MTAALVAAATTPLLPTILAILVRAGLHLPAPPPRTGLAAHLIAAALADYSWRAEQLAPVHAYNAQAITWARQALSQHDAAIRTVTAAAWPHAHAVTTRRPRPAGANPATVWPADPVHIGRPPARRIPGATLTGAAA